MFYMEFTLKRVKNNDFFFFFEIKLFTDTVIKYKYLNEKKDYSFYARTSRLECNKI